MTQENLDLILSLHIDWLKGKENGKRADLKWADLSGANLRGADLSGAYLSRANLSGADLYATNQHLTRVDKQIITITGVGSANRQTMYDVSENKVTCGCFNGTLDEFELKIKTTHAENYKNLNNYLAVAAMLRSIKLTPNHQPKINLPQNIEG